MNLTPDRPCPTAEAYEQHWGSFFIAGCTAEEIAAAPKDVRRAYATWKRPPQYELYDLREDPHELQNLAGSPEHAAAQERLTAALSQWQRDTADPFADPNVLARYLEETGRVSETYGGSDSRYRRDKSFRWDYLEYLAPQQP